jgi:hypothetical protein
MNDDVAIERRTQQSATSAGHGCMRNQRAASWRQAGSFENTVSIRQIDFDGPVKNVSSP